MSTLWDKPLAMRIGSALRAACSKASGMLTPPVLLGCFWFLFLIYSFPGYMSYDSVWQLQQAREVEPLSNWHPPLMAFLWRFLDYVIAGPFLMLVVQSLAFLLGLYALLCRIVSRRTAAVLAGLILIAPQNVIVMAVIWKDCQMAGFFLAAIPLVMSSDRRLRVLGYGFFVLATGVRYNAAAAVLPLLVLLRRYDEKLGVIRRVLVGTGWWLLIAFAAFGINSALTQKQAHVWQIGAAPVDLIGTIRFSKPISDEWLLQETPGVPWKVRTQIQRYIRNNYSPLHSFLEITGGDNQIIEYPTTQEHFDGMSRAWRKLVFEHPWPFIYHRWLIFKELLSTPTGGPYGFWVGFTNADWAEDSLHHRAKHGFLQLTWIRWVERFDVKFGLRVRVYFALSLVLMAMPFCWRQRVAFATLASGVCFQLGLLVVAPAIDYRYSHWMVVCTLIAVTILVATGIRARRASGPTT